MRLPRSLALPAAALALIAGGLTIGATLPAQGIGDPTPPAAECDGTPICPLPDTPANKTKLTAAWDAWDNNRGWTLLRVDPDAPMKVMVTGWSVSRPATDGGLALLGRDGRWYVFHATYTDPQ